MNIPMKKTMLSLVAMALITVVGCDDTKKETAAKETASVENTQTLAMASFGVRGNCGMCKATIEKAANGVDGVAKADWNVDKKFIDVSFDSTKTDVTAIKKAIAASGYDTEGFTGSDNAYENLPACCQYDHSMDMNQ